MSNSSFIYSGKAKIDMFSMGHNYNHQKNLMLFLGVAV